MEWFCYPLRVNKEQQRSFALTWSRIKYNWKIMKTHLVASLEVQRLGSATSEIWCESGHLGVYSHLQPILICKFGPQVDPEVWKHLNSVVLLVFYYCQLNPKIASCILAFMASTVMVFIICEWPCMKSITVAPFSSIIMKTDSEQLCQLPKGPQLAKFADPGFLTPKWASLTTFSCSQQHSDLNITEAWNLKAWSCGWGRVWIIELVERLAGHPGPPLLGVLRLSTPLNEQINKTAWCEAAEK